MFKNKLKVFLFVLVTAIGLQTLTYAGIQFKEGEYIRITQPANQDKVVITFDDQMNLMGEARVGTEITIKVYKKSIDKEDFLEDEAAYDNALKNTYELKAVGATSTFNQLIDLSDGPNTIVITYSTDTKDTYKKSFIYITKESKELLNNYLDIGNPYK